MKKIETILEKDGCYDSKHILNTCSRKVPEEILDKIESGITFEDLEEISKSYDVYKYRTQITIHGVFGELRNNRIGSYKNLFQNKNKSIGVKWNAIDFDKRIRLFSMLRYLGFTTIHNSQELKATKILGYNAKNVESLKELYGRVDQSLFVGNTQLYVADFLMARFIVLDLNINAFKKENLEKIAYAIYGGKDEYERIKANVLEKEKIQREEFEKRMAKAREDYEREHAAEIEAAKERMKIHDEYVKKLESEGWKRCVPQVGDVWVSWSKRESSTVYYTLVKSFGKMIRKRCDKDGVVDKSIKGVEVEIKDERLCKPRKEKIEHSMKEESSKDASNADLKIIPYNEGVSFAVIGDTYSVREIMKAHGGKFNRFLKCGAGWIFPLKKRDDVAAAIGI